MNSQVLKDLIDKGYCSDCNELNCIDNLPHAKITHAIRELQQENQSLKKENKILRENTEHNDKVVDKVNWENMLLKKENEQLKDNWNKLKECLKEVMNSSNGDDKDFVETILNIMQELEQGSD